MYRKNYKDLRHRRRHRRCRDRRYPSRCRRRRGPSVPPSYRKLFTLVLVQGDDDDHDDEEDADNDDEEEEEDDDMPVFGDLWNTEKASAKCITTFHAFSVR